MNFDELAERLLSYNYKDLGQGVSDDEISRAEKVLGVQVTGSYREFLRRFGWGGVEHIELYGLGHDVPDYLHLVKITISERADMAPPLRQNLLPLLNDGGGNLYCLDCSTVRDAENPVVFWQHDHEDGSLQELDSEACSFAEWLSRKLDEI